MSKTRKVIITAALTGLFHGKETCPVIPLQPEEIEAAAVECWNAGASIVHIHVRDKSGRGSNDRAIFEDVNARIRAKTDLIIQNSIAPPPYLEIAPVDDGLQAIEAGPDMCSLDMGPVVMEFEGTVQYVPWTRSFITKAAAMMKERGIKPEMEIFNHCHVLDAVNVLIAQDLISPPYSFSFVFGQSKINHHCVPFSMEMLNHYLNLLPPNSMFSALGIGATQMQSTIITMLAGGNMRVGLEDNIFYRYGEQAKSNAQFVERAARIIRECNLDVATPDEARAMLDLPAKKK